MSMVRLGMLLFLVLAFSESAQARDYEAATGRYIESDPIGLASGLNTYAYVINSPLDRTDRYGLRADTDLCAGLTPEQCMNAGGTPYWGWDAQLGFGRGRTSITCTDDCGKKHTYIYKKICTGAAYGLGLTGGGAFDMNGPKCKADRYAGWFLETGASVGPLGLGADIGYNEDGPAIPGTSHRMPGSMSGVVEGGLGIGAGAPARVTYCYYILIGEQ